MNRLLQRVLLVEDNEDDYIIVRDLLDDITDVRVEIEWVTTYETAQEALRQGQYDVCLLDYRLGGRTGLELLEELPASNRIPIILLTGNEDHKVDVAATKAGASDYLVKGHINTPLLERAIRYAIEHKRTTEALRFSEERYRAFVGNSTEAIWCWELKQPVSVFIPEDEQIELFYEHGYLSECNEAMASLYGFSDPTEIIGAPLGSLLVRSKPENITYLRSFIRSCYRLSDAESCEIDRYGSPKYFLNNLVGIVENGIIHRVWGTQRDFTERREAEIMRAQLAAIVESSEDAIISKNLQGIITTWNSAAQKLYGFAPDEAIGQSISIIIPSGSLISESQLLDTSQSGETATQYETIRAHKNGSKLNVSLSIAPIKDAHGNIVGDSSIERDITERKRAEEALKKSELELRELTIRLEEEQARLVSAQSVAKVGSWEADLSTGLVLWSHETYRIFEIDSSRFEQTYQEFLQHVHSEDRVLVDDAFIQSQQSTSPNAIEHRIVMPDGRIKFVEERWQIVRDEQGKPLRAIGTVQDITQRKEGDELLRISNERFEILSRATNDAVWDLNLLEDNLWWNEGFETLFGYKREQIEPHLESWSSRLHAEDAEKTLEAVHAAIASHQQSYTGEYRFRRFDGSYAYVYDRGFIIYDADNRPMRMVGSMQDITERKQSEETLRASEEKFQSIVANVPGMVYQFARHPDHSIDWPFISDGCRKMFEVEPETIKRNPLLPLDMIHPDDRDGFDSSMTVSEATLKPWSWEGRLRTPSGKNKWIQGASFPQRMKSGGTLCTGLLMDITARKEAEAERDRFFTMSLDMLCIAGFDGYLKRVNPAFTEILGYSESELLRRPFLDLVHPDDQASTRQAVENLMGGNAIIGFENRYLCQDGSWRWLEWKSVATVEEGMIYAAARDVTKRKETDAALLQMRDELEVRVAERTAELAKSNEALQVQIKVREGAEAEIHTRARQQEAVAELGRRALTEVGMSTLLNGATALVAATLDAPISTIVELLPEGAGLRFCAATGWDVPAIVNIVSGENYSQAAYALASNIPTIVSDLRSETRFAPSPLLLEAGVVSSVTVIVGGYAQPFGTLAAHTKKHRIFSQDDVHFLEAMANVLAAAIERRSIETEIRQLNEQLEESNELLRIENIERQMALNALRESAEVLESAKEEAEIARETAEIANRAKSEFLSRMSHELRTPLNAVLGFGQILAMHCPEGETQQRDNIQQILKAGRHLLDLINEVLDIARIEAGHLSLSQEPIPIYELAREVLHLVRPLAAARAIDLDNDMPAEYAASYVLADQQRLKQVLLNFLSNAVKYNRQGGQVSVGCEIVDGPPTIHNGFKCEGNLRLFVKDTGNGLTAEEMMRLFVPFERLGAARTQIEGSGIGLSLCKQLIEAMNGQVGVESQSGEGSTFWLQLPLVNIAQEGLAFSGPIESNDLLIAKTPVFHDLHTILYIEDNLSNIKLIENLLSGFSPQIRLLTAMQGSLGIELAEQHHPDLILLDVNLPDMQGDVVLGLLKANPLTGHVPVVVLSADATSSQRERMRSAGASHYLTKPLDIEHFLNVLRETLYREKRAEG